MLEIRTFDDPILRQVSEEITSDELTEELHTLARDMVILANDMNGIGLAAPQIGVSKRLIVVQVVDRWITMINPVITKSKNCLRHKGEGCLSFPEVFKNVPRFKQITVEYTDLLGESCKMKLKKLDAYCVQHEIDHLDGIVIGDFDK